MSYARNGVRINQIKSNKFLSLDSWWMARIADGWQSLYLTICCLGQSCKAVEDRKVLNVHCHKISR